MAAPSTKTLATLNGRYITNFNHSTSPANILALQGINWFIRQAICAFPVTLAITCYSDDADPSLLHIDIEQTISSGLPGTTERRQLDWKWNGHTDHIFGEVKGRSRWVKKLSSSSSSEGVIGVEKMKDETDEDIKHLVDGFLPAASAPAPTETNNTTATAKVSKEALASASGMYLENQVVSDSGGWTAHQLWGFENVDGLEGRRYVRHVVVRKGEKVERARLVYDYLGELQET